MATFGIYYVYVTPTQIILTQTNPSNPLNYGDLRLSGSTGVSSPNSSAILEWYTPGDPWVVGGNNFAGYTGQVGSHGSGPYSQTAGGLGTDYPWVVATAVPSAVPIPAAVWLLGSGLIGLIGIRRRFKK